MSPHGDRVREVRVALVLYGGVSLAVYENGVAGAFFDFVRGRAGFDLLLDMLDAEAVVDVVAGTSAGGINGLMLAAALESGGEFDDTADLWRRHGDLGALLLPLSRSGRTMSLLDGEDYYQNHLAEAFRRLNQRTGTPTFSEMDVFITGTDLEGYRYRSADDLGNVLEEKGHRVVFHLKHRPDRRHLGLAPGRAARDHEDEQAAILASISRITSTFPGAFPAFRLDSIPARLRDAVRAALAGSAEGPGDPPTAATRYVDGGVLDNKPFGPALRAIFTRMPSGLVDRRVFFVEPDPDQFQARDGGETVEPPVEDPLRPVMRSLFGIPQHEGIRQDLERIQEHNQKVQSLLKYRDGVLERLSPAGSRASAEPDPLYWSLRERLLARLMVSRGDDVPWAGSLIQDAPYRDLEGELMAVLAGRQGLNGFDPWFHLRRAYQLLYIVYDELAKSESLGDEPAHIRHVREELVALGRVIKFLRMVFALACTARARLLSCRESADFSAGKMIDAFAWFFDSRSPHWAGLVEDLRRATIEDLHDRESGVLSSSRLTEVHGALVAALDQLPAFPRPAKDPVETILQVLEAPLSRLAPPDETRAMVFRRFEEVDAHLLPIYWASGIYELDQVKLVRISPRDARLGLSNLEAGAKVAGDDLAHFAAFFRRDWRSNDMLWGRLDGISSIVAGLLDERGLETVASGKRRIGELFTSQALAARFSGKRTVTEHDLAELERTWSRLSSALPGKGEAPGPGRDGALREASGAFRDALARVIQKQSVEEGLERLYADLYYQEVLWGQAPGDRARAGSAPELIEMEAEDWARRTVRELPDKAERFRKMGIGAQTVLGRDGRVPAHVLAEYGSRAYLLLWEMLSGALERPGKGWQRLLSSWLLKLRLFLRDPIRAFRWLFLWNLHRGWLGTATMFLLGAGILALWVVAVWKGYPLERFVLMGVATAVYCGVLWVLPRRPGGR